MRDVESFVRFKMAASKGCFVVSLVIMIFFLLSVSCLPEPGKKDLHFDKVSDFCLCWLNNLAELCVNRFVEIDLES